jgi:hypothetical protein
MFTIKGLNGQNRPVNISIKIEDYLSNINFKIQIDFLPET